uniref:Uncharacterized protein n=1 Tax=Megaselia scalaris TaxID=36166 RepID=T1GBY2_MEGSC
MERNKLLKDMNLFSIPLIKFCQMTLSGTAIKSLVRIRRIFVRLEDSDEVMSCPTVSSTLLYQNYPYQPLLVYLDDIDPVFGTYCRIRARTEVDRAIQRIKKNKTASRNDAFSLRKEGTKDDLWCHMREL